MVAQFKCGVLPLRVETGRHCCERWEDRLCTFCFSGEIENDVDVLKINVFVCVEIDDEISVNMSPADRFKYLINNCPIKVANYLVNAYLRRKHM